MTTYYVSTDGIDNAQRDGRSWETAWASLSYASDRVPEGNHTIRLSAGDFIETQTAQIKSGLTVSGTTTDSETTQIIASKDWAISPNPNNENESEYLINLQSVQDVTIKELNLRSSPNHFITGAVRVVDSNNVQIHSLNVESFRWVGLQLDRSEQLNIHNNHIKNASTEKSQGQNGLIRSRFIKHSRIHNNTITSTEENGYGYKGGGHENVRIHHNTFLLPEGFAIESAHENEFGVEIDHNFANQTISVPKSQQSPDPSTRGYDYSFWIHHNFLTDSYTIEGPRNHLRVSHNYVRIDQPNGRVYTHHGGENQGPVWLHHNVIENVDRALVWMNRGKAENIHVFNNTISLANSPRAGALFGAFSSNRLNNWIVENNVVIAPEDQPRTLFSNEDIARKIETANNLFININDVPAGNFSSIAPGFVERGERPFPFYAPATDESFIVDRGVTLDSPFHGEAPDIGAYELGENNAFPVQPVSSKTELFSVATFSKVAEINLIAVIIILLGFSWFHRRR